jgi:hypothetical protein
MRTIILALVLVLLTSALPAQNVVVGTQSLGGTIAQSATPPFTMIDLSHPATADGTVASASVRWSAGSCTAAFKLKFLRPANPSSLTTFTLVAERGPFNAVAGRNQIVLVPPVDIHAGDLIAVTSLGTFATCGSPATIIDSGAALMRISGDVSTGSFNGFYSRDRSLGARATDTTEVLEGVVTAAGSLAGNFGSFFRTSVQIASPGGGTSTGTLVFHPAGVAASPNDQAFPYTATSGNAISFTDIVQQMGKSGLGTIDVISNNGFPPIVTARVYNDTPNGTSGFTEEMIAPRDALHFGDTGVLLTPPDLTKFRVNIGVRTFSSPATINVQYGFRSQSNMDFPANTFRQYSLAEFGDASPLANEQIILSVQSGDAIVYLSTTDNQTNDSSVRFARRN